MSPRAWYGNGKPSPSTKAPSPALKARTGRRGMSTYVESLIQRQPARDRLRELIEDAEAQHGAT
ncbi:hypothetical protein [Streptomyces bottropensis]|uniref:hypothetical protein n=1 Tax=Streptomyces bottropensis TaxID=42235 RepID=UPI0036783F41